MTDHAAGGDGLYAVLRTEDGAEARDPFGEWRAAASAAAWRLATQPTHDEVRHADPVIALEWTLLVERHG
ncbi:hypothetical protein [Nocardioides jishulii]|uniref:Uncharacterized protein n=1 Tax=Nocardioides jishulii TaxID=2575440 RepID=A0A4U2YI74_9ACTN|nr:hypothetical protein [Nocardioides jishulii]QCX28132.1 hypothetical protein FCL41_11820 [Nocardioides jishulii]TKI60797.1 hypothetical protein FC770_14895 [Nocardioides jishulii]